MTKIKVTINPEQNLISVYNSSRILVEIHKEEKVYIPELIFEHNLILSNYDNSEKSTEFIVWMASKESGKKYYQRFTKNMSVIRPPKITKLEKGEEFQMNYLNADFVGLLKQQVYDICAMVKGISMLLNDSKLNAPGPNGEDLTKWLVFERVSERWDVSFIPSSLGQLQQVSFINSISTSKGSAYVNYVVDAISGFILGISNLEDADKAGTQESHKWNSTNALLLNVWDACTAQIKGNKELIDICKIMCLNGKVDNLDTSKLWCGHLNIIMD
ncbi:DNA topoisomerase 2 [Massospora cicadina]|nr:DNA topoisomerase 2 [Massospora cicadina]